MIWDLPIFLTAIPTIPWAPHPYPAPETLSDEMDDDIHERDFLYIIKRNVLEGLHNQGNQYFPNG